MRKIKTNLLFLLLVLTAGAAYAGQPFTINGSLRKADNQTWAHVYYQLDGKRIHDSVKITDGRFTLTGNIAEPVKSVISITTPSSGTRPTFTGAYFYLEAGNITVTNADTSRQLRIGGTPLNEEYSRLEQALSKASARQADTALNSYAAIAQRRQDVYREFVAKHPASQISLDLVLNDIGGAADMMQKETLFNNLSPALKNSTAGVAFTQRVEQAKLLLPGKPAPDFTEKDTAGIAVSLKDFRGKYVLIDFWASWCMPCRAENPHVLNAYNKYKDRNFTILGVSLDKSRADWIKAIKEDNLPWQQISSLDPQNAEGAKKYAVRFIPQNYLIDPEGKIIASNLRGEGLDKLDELLK
ncbi:TlpA disulfide reductase family protein [Chitinophaga ginsengisegetis]|uniref:TlpA disulfide reductase family protein n=1 Tax=Chitinophaga ginsengisegetis TaxID=393003 RepID=UPI000DBFC0DD|nr:TlpA disulfide reductase family protein [Chitinophaga ginsengisegetis]MDR6566889.1 peroxiredoxin [Chitinophaga ginsengisegetis]MDR6646619.1 peroxiredoxin [Chitinophaga ginsengisegetis]MDR6652969.1 peroxiredoxin [Chitinophaga ginsengisegetis]